jgi:hypothetical protein
MCDHIKQHITGGAFYGTVAAVLRDCTSIINNQPAGDRKELLETQDGRRSVERGDSRHAGPLGMVSSKGSTAKSSWAAQPEALREAGAAPTSSPTVEAERKRIALPNMERNRAIRENHGQFARLREVKLRKSIANLYRRSNSFQVGASRRVKATLIALWHHAESRDARFRP